MKIYKNKLNNINTVKQKYNNSYLCLLCMDIDNKYINT